MKVKQIHKDHIMDLRAYKSIGNITEDIFIHLVIKLEGNKFEHIIPSSELSLKSLNIIHRFTAFGDMKLIKDIKKKLEALLNKGFDDYTCWRYEGYTTEEAHKNILKNILEEHVITEDEKYIHVKFEAITEIIKGNRFLYGREPEELTLNLMFDGYLIYCNDDETSYYGSYYKVKKGE